MIEQSCLIYEFGPFRLDVVNRILLRDGEPIPLAPKAFDILLLLVENQGRALTKDELMSSVWPNTFVEEINLIVHISAVRKALGDSPEEHKYIATIPRRGYRFVASANSLQYEDAAYTNDHLEIAASSANKTLEQKEEENKAKKRNYDTHDLGPIISWRQRLSLKLFVAFFLLVGLAVISYFWLRIESRQIRTGDEIKSIAVLPFKPLNQDAVGEELGVGMADSLITKLSNVKHLIVRPTRSVLKYSDPDQDLLTVGRELGVEALLDGTIQREGDQIRVSVQLIRIRDGAPLWGDKFDKSFLGILEVQDSISAQLVDALMLQLTGEERKRLSKRYTENAEANLFYQRGLYCITKATPDSLNKSIEYLEKAIALDPSYAAAYASLADAYTVLGFHGLLPPQEAMPRARAALAKSLEIDDSLAEAHTALAFIKMHYDRDWPGAGQAFVKAIEVKPNYLPARLWYSWWLALMDRMDESREEMKKAYEIDPVSLSMSNAMGLNLFYTRQYDQSIEHFRTALEMDPGQTPMLEMLGLVYARRGTHREAAAALEESLKRSGQRIDLLGYAHATSGKRTEALKIIANLKKRSERQYVSPYTVARIYAGLGEKDRAFEMLEKAYAEHDQKLFWLKIDPSFDSLRVDARFPALLERMKLKS